MASERDDAVLLDDEDDDQSDDELDSVGDDDDVAAEDEEDLNSASPPSTSSAGIVPPTPTVAVNGGQPPVPASGAAVPASDPKRGEEENKKPPLVDDSRRLFQRLWTDEDEIELLQGFLEYTVQRGVGTGSHHHLDTSLFYDQIKSKLQLDFNKNQLVEKLRRLKKKYRNVLNKISSGKEFSFKSPHDQATFEISRKIWSNAGRAAVEDNIDEDDNPNPNPNSAAATTVTVAEDKTPRSRKRARPQSRVEEKRVLFDGVALVSNANNEAAAETRVINNNNVPGLIEETVRSCLSPLFKELLSSAVGGPCGVRNLGGGGVAMTPLPLGLGVGPMSINFEAAVDEKWRKQQILELEVYSKRLELIQDQVKAALEELRSTGG